MQEKKIVPQKFTNEFNDEGLTLHQLFLKTHHNLSLKAEEWYKNLASLCTVIVRLMVTLVATLMF